MTLANISHLSACLLVALTVRVVSAQDDSHFRRYTIQDLGTLGGTSSMAYSVNNRGVVSGLAALANGTSHATLWFRNNAFDIGAPGLGGANNSATLNSTAFTINDFGQAVGNAETTDTDPNGENFCGYGTGHVCLPFFWQFGRMTALATEGGPNGQAVSINARGEAVGVAETNIRDSTCSTAVPNQVLDYIGVVWNVRQENSRTLRPLPGDSVTIGLWINDHGEAVGQSGLCSNTQLPPLATGSHAVLWDKDGGPHDLGNLGDECVSLCTSPTFGVLTNTPLYIDDQSRVVGASVLAGGQTGHAFLWTKGTGTMQDLGTLPGDAASVALAINPEGEIVGISFDPTGSPRAFLRTHTGIMLDLNSLLPADAPVYALVAQFINEKGQIAGFGVEKATGQVHAFLATPVDHHGRDAK